MESIRVNIRNPKAKKLLEDMAEMDLISIKSKDDQKKEFFDLVSKIRQRSGKLSLEEIADEVKAFRESRK